MREKQMVPVGLDSFYITFSECENGVYAGRIESPIMQMSDEFTSLTRMIVLVESWLDAPREELARQPMIPSDADYVLEVIFRQSYDWQGKLINLRENTEATFRSVLELILQMEMEFA